MALSHPSPNTSNDPLQNGSWALGHTQKQSGSILQAGARALVTPTPITQALSSMQGRMMARTVMAMGVDEALFTYMGFRPYAINEVIKRELPSNVEAPLLVDPASGFSPQFYWLAQALSHIHCIEMDLPKNMQTKRKNLQDFDLPSNLELVEADLTTQSLHEVLGERKAHVLITLAAYVKSSSFVDLLRYLHQMMAEEGFIVASFPYAPGFDNLMHTLSIFRRLVTKPIGIVQHEDDIMRIFEQANYSKVSLYKLSDLAEEMGKPKPADVEIIAIARR